MLHKAESLFAMSLVLDNTKEIWIDTNPHK
jgi:hypothetical protein